MIALIFVYLTIVTICYGLLYMLADRWRKRHYYTSGERIPGPRALPIIGNVHTAFTAHEHGRTFEFMQDLCVKYGTPSRIWVGSLLFVFIDQPEHVKIALTSPHCIGKPYFYRFLRWNNALFPTRDAELWKAHRKLLNPSFNFKHLLDFMPIFNAKSLILVDQLEAFVEAGVEIDIFEPISLCTLELIVATALGLDLKIQERRESEHVLALERIFELVNRRIFNFYHYTNLVYERSKWYSEEKQQRATFDRIINIAMERKRVESFTWNNSKEKEESKSSIFIDRLFELSKITDVIDEGVIADQLRGMIFAGNETTALTVSSVILMLAIHQDVQQRCVQEILDAVGDGLIDYEAISKLNYLEMVIRETGRLFTLGPILGRRASADIQIGDYLVPKKATLIFNVYRLHRRPELWGSNPESFDPDRFLPEEMEKRHPYAYIPFSAGLRNCIGLRYAGLSMKTILCHVLRKYKFTTHLRMEELKTEMNITLKLTNRHMVKIERRV